MKQLLAFFLALAFSGWLNAQEAGIGEVQRIATRQGVSVPIYTVWRKDAVATVVLYSGGSGGYGKIGEDGWPASGNFLIRTGKHWASYPFNIVMVGRPTDGIDLSNGAVRIGEKHNADNVAIFKAIKLKSPLPIWVVGTSMGSISAAAAAIADDENLVSGVVLTSSITAYKIAGAVPKQELGKIRVPTLVLHHNNDACWACQAHEAKTITGDLVNAPIKKTIIVTGGGGESGDPCQPLHFHGFIGMSNEAVDIVAKWIIKPTASPDPN